MSARHWPLPADSGSSKIDAYKEQSTDHRVDRGRLNDDRLAGELDISVQEAHRHIEDVTEHRTTDLDDF